MNTKIRIAITTTCIFCFSIFSGGCSDTQSPVRTNDFSLADVKSIVVDYDGESVTVKESGSDKIVIVEHMDKTKKSYFAKMDLSGGVLTISEGARPIGNGVHSYLEIYLPGTYQDALSIHTTDGEIISNTALMLSSFQADTTNGKIKVANLTAQICTVDTTNADTFLDSITGMIEYESKGGNLILEDSIGNGNFQVTGDGSLEMTFAEVTGDITAHTKNGNIALTLPDSLNFAFTATAQNGSIQTSFSELLSAADHTVAGTIGDNADVKIRLETKNGAINVTK